MKKVLKLILLAVTVACLLTGCYKQDTKISVNQLGKVKVDIAMMGTDEAVSELSGGGTFKELAENIMPQIDQLKENDSMTAEEVSEEVNGETLNGIRITAGYSSVSEMNNSVFFQAFNSSIAVPVTSADTSNTGNGITLRDLPNAFGTVYTINGTVSVSQGRKLEAVDAEKLKNASVTMKISFPFCAFGSNGKILNPSHTVTVNAETPTEEVHFWVFIPNFAFLIALILLIALIVVVLVLLDKIKKLTPPTEPEGADFDGTVEDSLAADDENFFEGNFENIYEPEEETENETEEETFDEDITEDTEE